MKPAQYTLLSLNTLLALTWFTILFDPSGVALGSGFEFLGTIWILANLCSLIYNSVGVAMAIQAIEYVHGGIDKNE